MPEPYFTLVTGASEGLGKFLALECARRKHNLVLVALPGGGLHKLAAYIKSRYHVQVACFETDLSTEKNCFELYGAIREGSIRINCLIHNAGIGGSSGFGERDSLFYTRQIALNVTAPTMLTRLLLDELRQHAPAHVLNVGSLAGFFTLPNKPVYSATKAYLIRFSKSLRQELRSEGINVSLVCPGGMDTRWELLMEHRIYSNWLCRQSILHPARVAAAAVDGMLKNKALIIPGFWNKVFLVWNQLFPGWLKNHLTRYQMNTMKPVLVPLSDHPERTESIAV